MKIDINKQYETTCGKAVRIITTEGNNPDCPVICEVLEYLSGTDRWVLQYNNCDGKKLSGGFEIVEVNPYKDWKTDDKIWVSEDKKYWYPRHFRMIDDGTVICYANGTTSFSSDGELSVNYKYAIKDEGVNPNCK